MRRLISSLVGVRPEFLFQFTGGAQELVHALVHVNGNTNGARLVGDGAGDGLADPPRGVSRKLVAAPVFELVGGAHQADVAFLNQVEQMEAAVDVLLRDRNHQAKVGFHQVFLGALGFLFAVADHGQGVLQLFERGAGGDFALADFALQFADARLHGDGVACASSFFSSRSRWLSSSTARSISRVKSRQRTKTHGTRANGERSFHLSARQYFI